MQDKEKSDAKTEEVAIGEIHQKVTQAELDAAMSAGLKKIRTFGGRRYGLVGVVKKEDEPKRRKLIRFVQVLRARKVAVRIENKVSILAAYALIG